MEDLKNGSSDRDPNLDKFLKEYKEATGNNFTFDDYRNQWMDATIKYDMAYKSRSQKHERSAKEALENLEQMNEVATTLLDYYRSTYSEIPDEDDEKENAALEERVKLREELQKELSKQGIVLNENQHVYVDSLYGHNVLVYELNGQMEAAYVKTQMSSLISRLKSDSEKLRDVHNSRTREKNVDSNAPAVKITKRERTDSAKESEKNKSVAPKGSSTFLNDISKLNKEIRKVKTKDAFEAIKSANPSNIMNRNIKASPSTTISRGTIASYVSIGKKASESKSVLSVKKQTFTQKVDSFIKSGAKAVRDFIKNPLNIQKNTTTTTTTIKKK